jgi:hypothetical protein
MRFTVAVSAGPWGGFYVHRGFFHRLCLGWVAITVVPVELDDLMEAYVARATKASKRPGSSTDSNKQESKP